MRLIRIALLNFKVMIKDKKVILLMLVMPFVVSSFICYIVKKDTSTSSFSVAMVLKDKGSRGKALADEIIRNESNYYKISLLSEDESKSKILDGKILASYIISEDFSEKIENGEKPEIRLLKASNENISFKLGQYIDEYINKEIVTRDLKNSMSNVNENLIKENLINIENKTKENSFDYSRLILVLIINFIIFSANQVSGEILAQRKEKTLVRQLTTPNKSWEISGGMILGFALVQAVVYSFVIIAIKLIFKLEFQVSMVNILIGVFCMVAVSVSIGLFAVRITSNEGVLSIMVTIIGVGMGFVSGSFTSPNSLPSVIKSISKFTPQYWFMELMKGESLLVSCLIILLFALVFSTAGSLKFTRFAKE